MAFPCPFFSFQTYKTKTAMPISLTQEKWLLGRTVMLRGSDCRQWLASNLSVQPRYTYLFTSHTSTGFSPSVRSLGTGLGVLLSRGGGRVCGCFFTRSSILLRKLSARVDFNLQRIIKFPLHIYSAVVVKQQLNRQC